MIRLARRGLLVVLFCASVDMGLVSTPQAQELVRTGQMWGVETSEGKIDAQAGLAGECRQQPDRSLSCQFVSFAGDGKGQCIVGTWWERLRFVSVTPDRITWAGTSGPSGLAGALRTSTLKVERDPEMGGKTFNVRTPTAFDLWSYKAIESFADPDFAGKKLPSGTREVNSRAERPSLRCNGASLFASYPEEEEHSR